MPEHFPSLHVLGSRQFGGADQFYVRLVRALHQAGDPVTAVNRSSGPVAKALEGTGVEQIHLPLANQWDVWTIWRMRQLVAQRQPCVVQTYMGRATRLTRMSKNGPAVHVARLGGYYKIDGYYRHAHAWIGNTNGVCDYLIQSGLPAEQVFQIGNFVSEPTPAQAGECELLRREWSIPDDAWVLFALGRLIDIKGFDDLLRALSRLPASIGGRPLVVLIAGDGPLAEDLRALTEQLGLAERVRWLGWQNPPDPCYRLADVFVCPSRRETLGNVILEAWSYGLPVVSTRTPGALELVVDGHSGLLCDIGDCDGLADAISRLLSESASSRSALGEVGQAYLRQHCSQSAIVQAYRELYQDLMNARGLG